MDGETQTEIVKEALFGTTLPSNLDLTWPLLLNFWGLIGLQQPRWWTTDIHRGKTKQLRAAKIMTNTIKYHFNKV